MRVCLIASVPFPPEEGLGYHVWNLAHELKRQGHQAEIITRGGLGATRREVVDDISIWRARFAPVYPFHVHMHGLFVNHLLGQIEDCFDVVNVHTPLPPPVDTRLPIVTTVHSPMKDDTAATRLTNARSLALRLQTPVSQRIEENLLRRSRVITAVASWVTHSLRHYGVDPAQVSVTGNGVENCFLDAQTADQKESYILCVGRIDIGKGLEDLVEAARLMVQKAPEVKPCFVLAGKGPLLPELKNMIERAGMQGHFELRGHIGSREELVELYRQAQIFVLPSHHEGMPTVLLEAMASGLPVVSTAVGGAVEVVVDRDNGLLVQAGQPDQLAEALLTMLRDAALRRQCAGKARKTIAARFSWKAIGQRYLASYERALEAQR